MTRLRIIVQNLPVPFDRRVWLGCQAQYMSFELPVVAFDLRETRVSAGDAAVYVKPTGTPEQDVRDYAQAIVHLIDDEAERDQTHRSGV